MVAADARQQIETILILCRCAITEPRLQKADHILVDVAPKAGFRAFGFDKVLQVAVRLCMGHWDVARQKVEERRNVGRSLDRGVAAQRENAAARTSDVAEQELED